MGISKLRTNQTYPRFVYACFPITINRMMPRPQSAQILANPSSRGYSGGSNGGSGNFFTRFLREEIFAQDKRQGNIDILVSIGVFGAAIAFIQNYAEELCTI
ncbi:20345_t:CDS:2 [Funneliformis geosporum]|uniref:11772_t:CDS:1 n=1 Tax=Funneliformis geosporum TaxID=1117311 RepID=A0A9W4SC46_9GLOM|nr:11772_t:CDS:2 [Funneliformis geosporum]CAI2166849.1 20345_t:CDS:2 [Funneliformis geosporum]